MGAMAERKFFDSATADVAVSATGTVYPSMVTIDQGNGESQRTGRRVTVLGVEFRGNVTLPAVDDQAAPPEADLCRILVVLDRQANGATFAVNDLLENTDVNSPFNADKDTRFAVLHEDYVPIGYESGGATDYPGVLDTWVANVNVVFDLQFAGVTGAVTELTASNFTVVAISKEGLCALEFQTRVWFVG